MWLKFTAGFQTGKWSIKSELFPHFRELFPLEPEKREIRGRNVAGLECLME